MTINLYVNSSPANYVTKTITLVSSLTGTLRSPTSIIDPTVNIEMATPTSFNYAFIAEFNRYYFVTGVSSEHNGLISVSMHVDVLMTYREQIRASNAILKRAEQTDKYNKYLGDDYFKAYQNTKHKIIPFPNGFPDFSYILALAGNGQTII